MGSRKNTNLCSSRELILQAPRSYRLPPSARTKEVAETSGPQNVPISVRTEKLLRAGRFAYGRKNTNLPAQGDADFHSPCTNRPAPAARTKNEARTQGKSLLVSRIDCCARPQNKARTQGIKHRPDPSALVRRNPVRSFLPNERQTRNTNSHPGLELSPIRREKTAIGTSAVQKAVQSKTGYLQGE